MSRHHHLYLTDSSTRLNHSIGEKVPSVPFHSFKKLSWPVYCWLQVQGIFWLFNGGLAGQAGFTCEKRGCFSQYLHYGRQFHLYQHSSPFQSFLKPMLYQTFANSITNLHGWNYSSRPVVRCISCRIMWTSRDHALGHNKQTSNTFYIFNSIYCHFWRVCVCENMWVPQSMIGNPLWIKGWIKLSDGE